MSRSSTMAERKKVSQNRGGDQRTKQTFLRYSTMPGLWHSLLNYNSSSIHSYNVNLWAIWNVTLQSFRADEHEIPNFLFSINSWLRQPWKRISPLSSSLLLHPPLVPNPRLLFFHTLSRGPLFSPPCHPLLLFASYRAQLKTIICLPVPEH